MKGPLPLPDPDLPETGVVLLVLDLLESGIILQLVGVSYKTMHLKVLVLRGEEP
jgi:hypothetical protein